MNRHAKRNRKSAKRFPRLSFLTVLAAAVILTVGVVTVLSIQRNSVGQVGKRQDAVRAADERGKNYVTVRVADQDVQVDGQTGQIKPLTPEEAERLAAGLREMLNTSTEGLVSVQQPDGSVSIDLEDRFQNVTVARQDEDGSLAVSCVDNHEAAGAFFGIDPKLIEGRSGASKDIQRPSSAAKGQMR